MSKNLKKPEDIVEEIDLVEKAPEEVEEVVEIPKKEHATLNIIIARDGDSYASLAEKHAPAGVSKRDYARELVELNGGAVVRPGARVLVK